MVITVEFSDEVDLNLIANKLENTEYAPDQFPGLVYRMKKPKATFLVFSSGKMNCTGVRSLKEAKKSINEMLKIMKRLKFKVHEPRIEVQNVVASCEFGKPIKLEKLLDLEGTEYEPEQFPGLVYRTNEGVAFLIFSCGKIVCVGAKSVKQVNESINYLFKKLKREHAFR